MILRLSQKLNTKIKAGKLATSPLNENPYADWSCHLFTVQRTQYILLSNTASLYSCVIYGAGITDEGKLIERALAGIREFMEEDGQAFAYEKFIIPTTETVTFAKALNRSVTGSQNELVLGAKHGLLLGEETIHEIGFSLNDLLLSAIATEGDRGYAVPRDAFKRLGAG